MTRALPAPKLAAVLVLLLVRPAFAMAPPTMSAEVSPGTPLLGLGSATGDGFGVHVANRHSKRDALRRGADDVANPNDESNESRRTVFLLDMRLARRWSAAVSVPFVQTEASFRDPATGARVTENVSGLGDVGVFGRYSLWKHPRVYPIREWLLLGGLEFGTGSITETDSKGARLPMTLQPGSGTIDGVLGTAVVWGFSALQAYGNLAYKANGPRAYRFGNAFTADAGVNVPFANYKFSLIGEVNGEFWGHDTSDLAGSAGREADGHVLNTGGEAVYVSPALQWKPAETMSITAGVQIPVHQNFRGTQLKSDLNFNLGAFGRFGP